MSGRQKTGFKRGNIGRGRARSPSPAPPSSSSRQRGYTATAQDHNTSPTNPTNQKANLKSLASTAVGVAAGSVVGHALGNTLSSAVGHENSTIAISPLDHLNIIEEICSPEIRQFFECASKNEDLDTCKRFHNTWFQCQKRYDQHRSQA